MLVLILKFMNKITMTSLTNNADDSAINILRCLLECLKTSAGMIFATEETIHIVKYGR